MSYYATAAFPKQIRKRDKKLLALIRRRPCFVCFKRPCDASHIRSRGAGGGDTLDNVIALCRPHHREWHRISPVGMAKKYESIRKLLGGR